MPPHPFLEVRKAIDGIAVTLTGPCLNEPSAQLLAGQLLRLAEEAGQLRLLLDCRHLLSATAGGLGMLVALDRGVRARGGQLTLCNVVSPFQEFFKVTRLDRVLDIRRLPAREHTCIGRLDWRIQTWGVLAGV
jgi:anti-anti-sigma factor